MVGSLGFEPRTSSVLDANCVPQAGILDQARRRPHTTRRDPYAEGNIVNTLIKLKSLGTSERNFICLASKDYLNAYALGLYRLRFAVRFGGCRYADESEVPIRKNWCSRVPTHRHYSCSCWLNVVKSLNCINTFVNKKKD